MEMERCHLWLGQFRDREQIDGYFLERGRFLPDEPISLFARDQGKRFYDHDWVFFAFNAESDLERILGDARVPEATRHIIRASAGELDFKSNALVVADEGEFQDPVSVQKDSLRLIYIGCHPLWVKGSARGAP
jgi:hypothetical protein